MRQAGREPVASALDFNKFDRDAERQANAAFIVRACNAHDALVAALRTLADYAEATARGGDESVPRHLRYISDAQMADAIHAARAALAAVEDRRPL